MIESGNETMRRLRVEDVQAALQLSAQAGWNQTEEDWYTLLELSPEGCLVMEVDGGLAATTTLLCYGRRLAWIGMVLKVDEISRWREGRLSDAALWSEDPYLAGPVVSYLSAPTPAGKVALRSGLLAWKQHKAWADIAVTDRAGNLVFSLAGETGPLPRDEGAALQQALSLHRPVLTDLHREDGVAPHLSAVAPLFAGAGGIATPAGAVVLRCDAASVLYPLILSWPTASRTVETLLVRREGDSVLFLNNLRYRPHAALELRVPMTRIDVPSVMAGDGVAGFVEGGDYRGVPVFADIRAIPGTPWFAVTKIDVSEAMAPWRAGAV